MEIKYNRFALLPHTCSKCEKSFWLEPYKYYKVTEFRLTGIIDFKTNICKECAKNINALKGEEEDSGTLEDKDIILEIDRETLLQEYIPKADYEARLKSDLEAILEELDLEVDELASHFADGRIVYRHQLHKLIRQKINSLKENEDGKI